MFENLLENGEFLVSFAAKIAAEPTFSAVLLKILRGQKWLNCSIVVLLKSHCSR